MNANMKYLISSDEREAENNLLWREVAGGRIWDQEFLTHPLHSPPMPSLLFHLTLSSSSWAVNPSHPAPPPQQGLGHSRQSPLLTGRNAWKWRVIPETKLSTSHCSPPKSLPSPPFPIYLYPSVPGDIKQSHNVFLMQSGIFLLWIYTRPVIESQHGPYSKFGRWWFACTRALNCRCEEMGIAEFSPNQKYR